MYQSIDNEDYSKGIEEMTDLQSLLQNYPHKLDVNDYKWIIKFICINETNNLSTEEKQLIDIKANVLYYSTFVLNSKDELRLFARVFSTNWRLDAFRMYL